MCFSATASFVAGTGLVVLGGVSLSQAKRRAALPFAAIPLLFGLQQLSEGLVWRTLETAPWGKSWSAISELFLFFALFVWPFWIAFSSWCLERDARRRRVLAALSIAGFALGAYLFACAAFRPVYACIAYQHIYYGVDIETPIRHAINAPYIAMVAASLFVSSVRGTSIFGAAITIAAAVAMALYRVGFASVWCFFSAILSVIVIAIVRGDVSEAATEADVRPRDEAEFVRVGGAAERHALPAER